MNIFWGIMLPFFGTTAGAACVFFLRGGLRPELQKALLGFASGVMVAASVWSLLIPAMELSAEWGKLAFVPAAGGFVLGILFLLGMDKVIPHLHPGMNTPEGLQADLSRSRMLMLAVTLHNIPEGMAIGVVFAGMLAGEGEISLAAALALSMGIAIQNFPEGAILSLPDRAAGSSRWRAFRLGALSGVVEPMGAGMTILLAAYVVPVLPWLLAFAAGAMIYVVVEELIPLSAEGDASDAGTLGFAAGFVAMMILDVTLG